MILTDLFLNHDLILIYEHRENLLFEPIYNPIFSAIAFITVTVDLLIFLQYRRYIKQQPNYFTIDKKINIFIFSLILMVVNYIYNFLSNEFIEPFYDNYIEHSLTLLINIIFLLFVVITFSYFIFFGLKQPYLALFFGLSNNLVESGMVGYFLASMSKEGPVPLNISPEFTKLHHFTIEEQNDLALNSISASGIFQEEFFEGVSIIPLSQSTQDLIAITFSFKMLNPSLSFDQRYNLGAPTIYALLLPSLFIQSLSFLDRLNDLFKDWIKLKDFKTIEFMNTEENLILLSKKIINFII